MLLLGFTASFASDLRPSAQEVRVHQREGDLAGLTVYLSAGHGATLHGGGRSGKWDYQRPEALEDHREDLWTAAFVADALVPALEARGATVLTPRERDAHPVSLVVDDADVGFEAAGLGRRIADGLGESSRSLAPFSRATWTIDVPEGDPWQLYARWVAGKANDRNAQYTVFHDGGADRFHVDQRYRDGSWWPLLAVAGGQRVEVVLESSGAGLLSADAVRAGGGSFTVVEPYTGTWHTTPAFAMSALLRLDRIGAPESLLADRSDARARARWAAWDHPDGEEAVYLSVHTDAGGGSGSTAFVAWDATGDAVRLANLTRRGIVDAARTFDASWPDRGTRRASYAEISREHNPEMPSVLVEVGFHDHPRDAAYMADPAFVADVGAAIAQAVAQWRAGQDAPFDPVGPWR